MADDRIETSASDAIHESADNPTGEGLATPGAHGNMTGGTATDLGNQPVPGHGERDLPGDVNPEPAGAQDTRDTPGATDAAQTHDIAEAQMHQPGPDLSGVDPDDVPDEPQLGQGEQDPEAPSRADIPDDALGAGSIDPSNHKPSGGTAASDRAHPLG